MTVSNNYAPVVTAANGVTTVFTAIWNAISAANLLVQLLNITTGIYTTVSQGVASNQYQVTSLTSSGLVITFNTAPVSGNNVIISRSTIPQQTVPYTTSRGFQGSVEENSFDLLTAMIQDNNYNNTLAVKAPLGDIASMLLPIASLRASRVLAFDISGNVIASDQTLAQIEGGSAGAAASAAAAAASATAAQGYVTALNGTSTTSIAIASGAQTFITQPNKNFPAGSFLVISSNANAGNYMHGQVTSYNSTTGALIMSILDIGGSGTHSDWNIDLSGAQGPAGSGGSTAFNAITGGTNTTATMIVGTGSTLSATGSGSIVSTSCSGNAATVTTNANQTGDVTSSGNTTTIVNVNNNVGNFTNANITVNAKGQVTAAANGTLALITPLAIGSIILGTNNTGSPVTVGTNHAGSSIQTVGNDILSGSWQALQSLPISGSFGNGSQGLWQRVS